MDTVTLASIVGLLVALSAASERLVEIVKGLWGWLDEEKTDDAKAERLRKTAIRMLAVVSGIATTLLAQPVLPPDLIPDSAGVLPLLALGLLASGGSGLWNAVLTYVLEIKNIKSELAAVAATKSAIVQQIGNTGHGHEAAADAMARLDRVVAGVLPAQ